MSFPIAFVIGLSAALNVAAPADAPPWSPEMFGALPSYGDVEISPDGRRVALLQSDGDAVLLVVREIDGTPAPARATRIEGAIARGLFWAGDAHLLVLVGQTVDRRTARGFRSLYATRWLAFSVSTLEARVLFGDEPGLYMLSAGTPVATPSVPGAHAVFARWTRRGTARRGVPVGAQLGSDSRAGGLGLLSVDLGSGEDVVIAAGLPETTFWQVGPDGEPQLRADRDWQADGTEFRRILVPAEEPDQPVRKHTLQQKTGDVTDIELAGRSAVNGSQLVFGRRDGMRGIWEYDLAAGALGKRLFSLPDVDIDSVVYDHRLAAVRGVRYVDDMPRIRFFDPRDERIQRTLAAALPKAAPLVWSRSADGSRLIVRAAYTDHPPQWFLYRSDGNRLDMIAPGYAALDGKTLPAKLKFDYVADDGTRIPGYLTVPTGTQEGPRPLVVLPHGGPQARDDQAFDFWSAFYAARGYLVYQPNFRGSDGYGAKFRDAGDGQWGRRMQQDIDDGVRRLIADGRAIAGRVCIVGASYGGYAALVGATMSGDLYACAVSVNGIANPGDLFDSRDPENNAAVELRLGKRHDRAALRQISPARRAAEARAPILLIHAKDDVVVPFGQSRLMAKELAKHGKPFELVELDGEDHWLSGGATRTLMLRRSIEFIDRHLKREASGQPDG